MGKGKSTPPTSTSVPISAAATTSNIAASSSTPNTTTPRTNDEFTFEDVLQNTSIVCDVIRSVGDASELLAPLKAIFGALKIAADTAVLVQKNGADLQDVIDKLNRHKNLIEDELKELSNPDFSKSKDVQGLLGPLNAYTLNLRDLYDELDILKRRYEENKGRSRFKSVLKAQSDQGKIAGYTLKLEDSFQQFMTSVTKFIARQTILLRQEVAVVRNNVAEIQAEMKDQAAKDALGQLAYADARGNQHQTCMEGTRRGLLESIASWSTNTTPIFALVDQAGTGKSTIAAHMVRQWEKDGLLLARYFFSKPSTVTGKDLASTVAREMAENVPALRPIIVDALDKHPNFTACSIWEQLEWIVFAPLRSLDTMRILVVDALDECSKEDRGIFLKHILDFISSYAINSCPLKILLTCRPEDDLVFRLREPRYAGYIHETNFQLRPEQHPSNEADIRLYAIALLSNFFSNEQINEFVSRAKGLFIWASTAYGFLVEALDPTERFEALMKKNLTLELLYEEILSNALKRVGGQEGLLVKVLQAICVAREPLTVEMMDEILGRRRSGVSGRVVAMLSSVLSGGNQGKPVHVLHPTFLEYLLNPQTCQLGVSVEEADALMATACLSICSSRLKYDMCDLHHRPQYPPHNKEIKTLERLLREKTTPGLRYATINVLSHVGSALQNREVVDGFRRFFSGKLLNWIEFMSLCGKIYSLIQSVQDLKIRIEESFQLSTTITINGDLEWCSHIWGIVQAFQGVIEESAMQVYFSALPFEPPQSQIARHYLPEFSESIPRVIRGTRNPQSHSMVSCGHRNVISCIAYAPDGHLVASGSWDYTLRLWDSATGAAIAELTGHTDKINCLEFSSDGKILASGSSDGTVRLWDPSFRAVTTALNGHDGQVTCLAFSPKERVLASASEGIVRLWDSITGAAIAPVRTRHTGMINCIAFSPDGELLASGYDYGKVQLWDPSTGEATAELTGHSGSVGCLAFSPDSKILASGSGDSTVRLWNPSTGAAITEMTGHNGLVNCLAFAPDSSILASGSKDNEVRFWNPNTGIAFAVLSGHTNKINCLAFSRDSKMLVTGSSDKTLRLWDCSTGSAVAELTGHTRSVNHLAFSPDGKMLASGSNDTTVRLWNPPTGAKLNGWTRSVNYPAFSPGDRMLASGPYDNTVQLWNPAGVAEQIGHTRMINCLAFSPDGKLLASGSWDKTVRIWDSDTGHAVGEPLLHQYGVYYLEFRMQNGHLVLITDDYKGPKTFWNLSNSPPTRHPSEELLGPSSFPTASLIQFDLSSKWTRIRTAGISFQLPPYFPFAAFCSHEGLAAYGGHDGSIIIVDCTHLV